MKYLNNMEEYIKEENNHTEVVKNILREVLIQVANYSHLVSEQITDNIDQFLSELNVGKLTEAVGNIEGLLGYGVFGAVFQLSNGKALKFTLDYHEAPFLYEYSLKMKTRGIVRVDDIFKIKFGNTFAYLIVRSNLDFIEDKALVSNIILDLKQNPIDNEMIHKYRNIGGESYEIFLALKSMYDIDSNWRITHSENLAKQKGNVVLFDGFSKNVEVSDTNIPFLNLNTFINEGLINKKTLDQLKKLREITKGIDIGDRVSKQSFPNQTEFHNAIDFGVQTYDEYMAEPFKVNQNVKNFKGK